MGTVEWVPRPDERQGTVISIFAFTGRAGAPENAADIQFAAAWR